MMHTSSGSLRVLPERAWRANLSKSLAIAGIAVLTACAAKPMPPAVTALAPYTFRSVATAANKEGLTGVLAKNLAQADTTCAAEGRETDVTYLKAEEKSPTVSASTIEFYCGIPARPDAVSNALRDAQELTNAMTSGLVTTGVVIRLSQPSGIGRERDDLFVFIPYVWEGKLATDPTKLVHLVRLFLAQSKTSGLRWSVKTVEPKDVKRYLPNYSGTPPIPSYTPRSQ